MTKATNDVPTLGALFAGFFSIGVSGFGGVLPFARRLLVEQRRWLDEAEFNDVLGMCQILPGPNVVNVSIVVGARFHGLLGAAAAFTGLLLAPLAIVFALAMLHARLGPARGLDRVLENLAAAAAGLTLATGVKMALPYRRDAIAIPVAALAFVAVGLLRLPLLGVALVLGAIGVALRARVAR
jgi:chromate transporter